MFGLIDKEGEFLWGYQTNNPVELLQINQLETILSVVMVEKDAAAEIHHYNLTNGEKIFLY